ncbi:MAG: hypothetical protein IPL53_00060 [Ignavibacteria bacterium]|nr:hypothetical protein [Ignavibacteria bacterium]
MKKCILIAMLLYNNINSYSQSIFQIAVGGTGNEISNSSIQTTYEGFVFSGNTNSFGAGLSDIYVTKVDIAGNVVWTKTIGGTEADNAASIIQSSDGGLVLTGSTSSFGAGLSDLVIAKLNTNGTLIWFKTIGGVNSEIGSSICRTADGGFVITGNTGSFGAGSEDICFEI